MSKTTVRVLIILGLIGIAGLSYLAESTRRAYVSRSEFLQRQNQLLGHLQRIEYDAAYTLAFDWKKVADKYLPDYERGVLHQTFVEAGRSDHRRMNHFALSTDCYHKVRAEARRRLQDDLIFPITDTMVDQLVREIRGVSRLSELGKVHRETVRISVEVANSESTDNLGDYWHDVSRLDLASLDLKNTQ